jgi:DNA-binding NtrC family response regulator
LNVVPIDLPPLRDREGDILLIAGRTLEEYAALHGAPARSFSDTAASLLEGYPWPGNVRELRNVIERAVLLSDKEIIGAEDLSIDRRATRGDSPTELAPDANGRIKLEFPAEGLPLEDVEKEVIRAALEHTRDNVTRAAELLHISRDTLRYRIGKYRLKPS